MTAEEAAFAAELTRLMLQERQARNLAPLGSHASLTRAAVLYAQVLATPGVPLSHFGPDGSSPPQRANAQGYNTGTFYTTAGENLALNYLDPARCFAAWLGSSGHRDNIISDMPVSTPHRRHLAVGVCMGGGKTVAVAMFGIQQFRVEPGPSPTPTPPPTPAPTPTPRVATLGIAAGKAGALAVTVPVAPRVRTLTVSTTGSPLVAPVTVAVLANQTRTVTLYLTASPSGRVATARTTDGTAAPALRFTERLATPLPVRPTAQVVSLAVPAGADYYLTVTLPAFERARSLSINVSGVPAVRPALFSIAAGPVRTVTVLIPASAAARTVLVRVSDGPRPTVTTAPR